VSRGELAGSRALVTGASRGIGAAIAVELAARGAEIVGTARRMTAATEVRDAVIAAGVEFTALDRDLASRDDTDSLVRALQPRGVDILICNAGLAERNPAEEFTDEQWDSVLEVDLTAQFRLARELGAGMLDRGSGRIVFVASMMTFQGGRNVISYTAAKSAIAGVVHGLANEWAGRGVNVNAVAPGYVETDLTSATHGDPQRRLATQGRIPAGRWGTPRDIAGPVAFLASPAADYVHGVVLPVDGGWLVR